MSSPLPPARLVRSGEAVFAPPRASLREILAELTRPLVTALGYAIALWPLTVVLLGCLAMVLAVSANSGP